jgi:hypothetical protein
MYQVPALHIDAHTHTNKQTGTCYHTDFNLGSVRVKIGAKNRTLPYRGMACAQIIKVQSYFTFTTIMVDGPNMS